MNIKANQPFIQKVNVVSYWKRRTEIDMSLFLPLILLSCIPLFIMFLFLQLVCHTPSLLLNACRLYAAMFVRGFPPTLPCSTALWLPPVTLADRTRRALHCNIYLRPFALYVIKLQYSAARYRTENCEWHRTENILTECHCNIARLRDFLYAAKVQMDRLHGGNNQIK
jgi:hypothetical protein